LNKPLQSGVSLAEAVALLEAMIAEPGTVLALREVDAACYGLFPFFVGEAEIILTFDGGALEDVAAIRIGRRFSNSHDWNDEPLNLLTRAQFGMLELTLILAGQSVRP
jgi:hypothetical protein